MDTQTRHALKQDRLIDATRTSVDWFQENRSRIVTASIAAVICLASFVTTLTGWQFKAVAKQFLVSKDALAILFGNFYFYAGILGLLFQLLLTTRLLRRFGIRSEPPSA